MRLLTSNEHRHSNGPGQQGETQQPAAKTTTVARLPGGLVHIHLLPPQALLVLINRHEVLRVLLLPITISVSDHNWRAVKENKLICSPVFVRVFISMTSIISKC